jgi:HAD superfamily hydrolase (TIGR01490 family)
VPKRKKFAVFDIDGTLIRWQLYHAVANALSKDGYFPDDTDQAIKVARMAWKKRDSSTAFKEYERLLVGAYDELRKTLKVEVFLKAVDKVFEEYKDQAYTYTRELIKQLKAEGYFLLAVSGSQMEIVKKIADYYKFDDYTGTTHGQKDGYFTGIDNIVALDKFKALTGLVEKHGLGWQESLALGDSFGDVPMLESVSKPIVINPELELYKQAVASGWKIVIERKNVVYELTETNGRYVLRTS